RYRRAAQPRVLAAPPRRHAGLSRDRQNLHPPRHLPGTPLQQRPSKGAASPTEGPMAQDKIVQHHHAAAEHPEHAAKHHREAAKHHEADSHEKAAHHAHSAHGHSEHAAHHAAEASKHHAEQHGDH